MRVVLEHKAIVKQKSRVALQSVGVENFLPGVDLSQTLNHKSPGTFAVEPASLLGETMIEHVCYWHQSVSLHPILDYPEYPRTH